MILSIELRDLGDHIKSVSAEELNSGTLRASASSMDIVLEDGLRGRGRLMRLCGPEARLKKSGRSLMSVFLEA